MEDREYYIDLFEIYETLLTEKQQSIFKLYYYEDLSLSEISIMYNKSKSYIGKSIQLINNKLLNYETKLQIYKKNKSILQLVKDKELNEQIKKIING